MEEVQDYEYVDKYIEKWIDAIDVTILNVHDRSVEENKNNSIIHHEFQFEFTSALICNGDKYPSSSNRFS